MRAALYARYSTGNQRPTSIADQLVSCRRLAETLGAEVVREFSDAAISGQATATRPGVNDLMAFVRAGKCDVVIAEHTERLSRAGSGGWAIFEDLRFLGVRYVTVLQGDVTTLDQGVSSLFSALTLEEGGHKTRRSMVGVVADGRHPGAPSYGYRMRREYDAKGEPIRGLREIDPEQATIVRRAFAEYLAGSSPQAIAARFNAEAIPGPAGGAWNAGAIGGNAGRVQGLLRNPLYDGAIVWGRRKWLKDRETGIARGRPAAAEDLVRQEVPDLRIVEAGIFAAVQARLAERARVVKVAGNPSAANRPKRLLSGLVKCGVCGVGMATAGPYHRYRCWARLERGPTACTNARGAPAERVEAEVLEQLRRDLLHPEVVEAVVREYRDAKAAKAAAGRNRRAGLERELAEVTRKAGRLVDQVADQVLAGRTVAGKIAELEARRDQLEAELAELDAAGDVVTLHPHAAARYRQLVEDLQTRLEAAGRDSAKLDAARAALRLVVRQVRIIPGDRRGQWSVELDADLTPLLRSAETPATAKRRAGAAE